MMLRDWPSSEVALEVSAASAETREQAARAVNGEGGSFSLFLLTQKF